MSFILLLLLCAWSLVASVAAFSVGAYSNTQQLASDLTLHWRIDGDTLALALVATDVPDGGWIGFGIAPRAQMVDAGTRSFCVAKALRSRMGRSLQKM